jgi:hypothetical protein
MHLGRMVAASKDVFPRGVMVLEVQEAIDFDARQNGIDKQAMDELTGLPIWNLTGIDMRGLDPEERGQGGFRGSPEVKVRLLAESAPQIPSRHAEGMGALVEFTDLMVTPYMNTDRCDGDRRGHRCRAELKYSLRATGMRPFSG